VSIRLLSVACTDFFDCFVIFILLLLVVFYSQSCMLVVCVCYSFM